MSTNAWDRPAPRGCQARDLSALIGLLAVLEGELVAGGVPRHLSDRIRGRLERAELLASGGTGQDLRRSINDLNHRLRHALGEDDHRPS